MINKNQKERKDIGDIEDILYYQVPIIKSDNMRKLLAIKFEIWIRVAKEIIIYLESIKNPDNDLIYYKVLSIIQVGLRDMYSHWNEEGIPEICIKNFNKWHEPRINGWMIDVKEICYRISTPKKKKDELMKKLTILLYKTVIDTQKGEMECES